MKTLGWISLVLLAVACAGKSRGDGSSTSDAGTSNAGASNAGAANAESCPDASSEPSEGAACPTPGMSCPGYGALSCPLTAECSADSKWQIHCSAAMLFGPCTCPHPDD